MEKEGVHLNNVGLVLEGGGMRGVYTAGVLEYFMEKNLYFPYVIGVSAGACNACSYISKQHGRNKRVTVDFVDDSRYLSYKNLIKEKSMFGMDFIFNEIPNHLVPFDFDAFYSSEQRFIIGTTDCHTGNPIYFTKDPKEDILSIIRASSSIPFIADTVDYSDYTLLDGGIADPIPIKKSIEDGNEKNVIVLTQNIGYTKKPMKLKWLIKRKYPQYKGLIDTLNNRYQLYNDTLAYAEQLEAEGKAIIIRPSQVFKVSRLEKKRERLEFLYQMGYQDAMKLYDKIINWNN